MLAFGRLQALFLPALHSTDILQPLDLIYITIYDVSVPVKVRMSYVFVMFGQRESFRMGKTYAVAIGIACIDEYYHAESWISEGAKGIVRFDHSQVGGMIPNAASVLAKLGTKTYLVTALNSGAYANVIREALENRGLDLSFIITDETISDPKCMIVNTPKERSILVVDSSDVHYPVSDSLRNLLYNATCIYTSMMEFHRIEGWEALASTLKQKGILLSFDCETSTFDNADDILFRYAGILFFNEEGWQKYKGGRTKEEAIQILLKYGVKAIVITLGSNGCYCRSATEEIRLRGHKVPVIDPTGAGDTFNSSFISCLMKGTTLRYAAEFANAAGAYAVTVKGTDHIAKPWDEMKKILYHTFRRNESL